VPVDYRLEEDLIQEQERLRELTRLAVRGGPQGRKERNPSAEEMSWERQEEKPDIPRSRCPQWEVHRTSSTTPAVQWRSVPRRLFFAAQQRIAIT